jgi:hypothetical protein
MLWVLRSFWRSLAAISGFIGVLYVWVDIAGLPEALAKPRALLMNNRELVLLWFCFFLVVLVVWRDLLPSLRQFMGMPPKLNQRWVAQPSRRFLLLRRLLSPVTIEYDRLLSLSASHGANFINFCTYAVHFEGRNNRRRNIEISATLIVNHRRVEIPFFVHVDGKMRTVDGKAIIWPFERFNAYASLSDPEHGQLIADHRISDAMFLRDYVPFTIAIAINGKLRRKKFSYSRIRSVIDHQRDRILFYEQGKA